MEEYFSQAEMGSEIQREYTAHQRGYDPLQEIYHWSLIIFLLSDEMILVGVTFVPQLDSISFLTTSLFWHVSFGVMLLSILVMMAIAGPCVAFLRYRREKRKRDMLRQNVLIGGSQPLAPIQPSVPFAQIALPIRLESRLNKRFMRWMCICGLVALPLLALDILTLQGMFWQFSFLLVEPIYLCSIFIPGAVAGIARAIQLRVAGHYVHPSLHINGEGISARYGQETIFVGWQDIRYFALVNSISFSKIPGRKAEQREAYEISDGVNRICWLSSALVPSYELLWFGERVLSAQDYASLTQQLASLIVANTGCSLLDFRLPIRKRKKREQPAVFYPSSVQKESV